MGATTGEKRSGGEGALCSLKPGQKNRVRWGGALASVGHEREQERAPRCGLMQSIPGSEVDGENVAAS